jgi:hypothetical protein
MIPSIMPACSSHDNARVGEAAGGLVGGPVLVESGAEPPALQLAASTAKVPVVAVIRAIVHTVFHMVANDSRAAPPASRCTFTQVKADPLPG